MKKRSISLSLITLSLLCFLAYVEAGIQDGLVAHYRFEENALDSSGNFRDGAEVGAVTYSAGARGSAAVLDGEFSHIAVSHVIGDIRSYSAWVKPSAAISSTTAGGGLFGRSVSAPAAPYCHIGGLTAQISDELISLLMPFQSNNDSIFYWTRDDVGQNIEAGWNHVVFVWDSTSANYRLYLNSQDKGLARNHNFPSLIFLNQMTIGGYGTTTGTFLEGAIDEVRIYNRSLSGEEVSQLYRELLTPQELLAELEDLVISLNLQRGISNSLDAKLDAAIQAIDDVNQNDDVAAVGSLNAFINATEAQQCGHLTCEEADLLIARAQEIIDRLGST